MVLNDYYAVIGNEATYRLATLLSRFTMSVQEIAHVLRLSQSHVSHKLALLRKHDYVSFNRDGKRCFYRLKEPWRSITIRGDVLWRQLSPEYRNEGSEDSHRLKELLGEELNSRLVYPVIDYGESHNFPLMNGKAVPLASAHPNGSGSNGMVPIATAISADPADS